MKAWGVHQVSEIATIYCGIVAGTVDSFPDATELQDQPFVCSIGKAKMGPFKTALPLQHN